MPMRTDRRTLLRAAGAAALSASPLHRAVAQEGQEVPRPVPLGPSVPPELYDAGGDWPAAQGNLAATREAAGATIDSGNVDRLAERWRFPITASTGYGGMTATPIVSGDAVYVQDMKSNVFALDRATGAVRWERRYDVPSAGPNGVALGYGLLFASLGDTAEVVALDAATGAERWRVRLSNNPGEGITMAPAVYDSTVYVSTIAGNTRSFNRGGTRGILFALEADSGATLWQFDTTTNNLWGSPTVNSGGGLWYPPSVDEAGGLYFGVANAAPWPGTERFPNGGSRTAPNDYASSAVALDMATGAVRWHYNAAPHDLFDHDFQNTPALVTVGQGEDARTLAICSGKTGTVVAIDRAGGGVIWNTPVGRHERDHLTELPEEPVTVYPGAWGGVLTPIALSGDAVYVPIVNHGVNYAAASFDKVSMFALGQATGELACLDLATGSLRWTLPFDSPATAGATVCNDLVVTAGLDGVVRIVDKRAGRLLASFWAGAGVNACPAVAGSELVVAAAGPLIGSRDSAELGAETASVNVICYSIAAA